MGKTIVVGAGVIGLACAYELARRGEQVTVIDKGEPGKACSEGNAGWITPSISAPIPAPGLTWTSIKWMLSKDSPLYIAPSAVPHLTRWLWRFWRYCNIRDHLAGFHAQARLNQLTLDAFDRLDKDGLPIELHRQGLLFVFLDDYQMKKGKAEFELLQQYGYNLPQEIPGPTLRSMEPVLSDQVRSGFLVEREYHVRPETLSAAYVQWLRANGGIIRTPVDVKGPLRHGGKLVGVETADGPIEGDRVLLAAGAWTGLVAERFGLRLPVQAGKGYSVTIPMDTPPFTRPLYLGDVKVGASPFDGAIRFAGTMELSGINTRLDRERLVGVLRSVGRYFREPLTQRSGREWVGMRPLTPDGLPMLGGVKDTPNLYVATGHAMLGVTMAPTTGLVMADLMLEGKSRANLDAFVPERFRW